MDATKQKPYKESSVKTAWMYLRTLNGKTEPETLDFLLDREVVLPRLNAYAPSTQRTIIFTIQNVARDFKREDILKAWSAEIAGEAKVQKEKGKMTEKQQAAYASLDGDAWTAIVAKAATTAARPHDTLDYIVPQLYTKFPPRRNLDYSEMRIATDAEGSPQFNYLVIGEEKGKVAMRFVFNRYKTEDTHGRQVFDVPDDLVAMLRNYIEATNRKVGEFLLMKPLKGDHLRQDDITDVLHRAFGKGISSQMLRHMFVDKYTTPERQKVIGEMLGDAEAMAHSIGTQQNVYVKTQ
jgi:hypothetical protein